jgi:hypothetical protein
MAPMDSVICLIPRRELRPDLMRYIADCWIEIPGSSAKASEMAVRWRLNEASSDQLLAELAERQALLLRADGGYELDSVTPSCQRDQG